MKIVLLGYMGSGKSTIAKNLSNSLEIEAIDLDDYIAEREQSSIPDIFRTQGEIYFRLQESKYLKELLANDQNTIVALGGGTPCYADNMETIKNASASIYLKSAINTLFQRLQKEKEQRPLIASLNDEQLKEFIAKHLFERRVFYEVADHIVAVDDKNIDEISTEILRLINK